MSIVSASEVRHMVRKFMTDAQVAEYATLSPKAHAYPPPSVVYSHCSPSERSSMAAREDASLRGHFMSEIAHAYRSAEAGQDRRGNTPLWDDVAAHCARAFLLGFHE